MVRRCSPVKIRQGAGVAILCHIDGIGFRSFMPQGPHRLHARSTQSGDETSLPLRGEADCKVRNRLRVVDCAGVAANIMEPEDIAKPMVVATKLAIYRKRKCIAGHLAAGCRIETSP